MSTSRLVISILITVIAVFAVITGEWSSEGGAIVIMLALIFGDK